MRRIRNLWPLCLAIFLTVALTTVSASAKSLNPVSLVSDYAQTYHYLFTHPRETAEIVKALEGRNEDENVTKIIESSKEAQALLRVANFPVTGGKFEKAIDITLDPRNTEQGRILELTARPTKDDTHFPKVNQYFDNPQIAFLNTPYFYKNPINIDPKIAYKTKNNKLVVWGIMINYSGKNVAVDGIPELQLLSNNKVLASGTFSDFESPMKLSNYQEKINTGIYNGLPTQCFVKMTFEPGTYDASVNLSDLGSLDCNYALNYRIIS